TDEDDGGDDGSNAAGPGLAQPEQPLQQARQAEISLHRQNPLWSGNRWALIYGEARRPARTAHGGTWIMRHPLVKAAIIPPQRLSTHRLGAALRLVEEKSDAPVHELARGRAEAFVEAALLAADEPLPPKKLAQAAGLADAAEAR